MVGLRARRAIKINEGILLARHCTVHSRWSDNLPGKRTSVLKIQIDLKHRVGPDDRRG